MSEAEPFLDPLKELETMFVSFNQTIDNLCATNSPPIPYETKIATILTTYTRTVFQQKEIVNENRKYITELIVLLNETKNDLSDKQNSLKNSSEKSSETNECKPYQIELIDNAIQILREVINEIHFIVSIGEYGTGEFNVSLYEHVENFNNLAFEKETTTIKTVQPAKNQEWFITVGQMFKPTVGAMAFADNKKVLIDNANNIYQKDIDNTIQLPKNILFIGFGEISKMNGNNSLANVSGK